MQRIVGAIAIALTAIVGRGANPAAAGQDARTPHPAALTLSPVTGNRQGDVKTSSKSTLTYSDPLPSGKGSTRGNQRLGTTTKRTINVLGAALALIGLIIDGNNAVKS